MIRKIKMWYLRHFKPEKYYAKMGRMSAEHIKKSFEALICALSAFNAEISKYKASEDDNND